MTSERTEMGEEDFTISLSPGPEDLDKEKCTIEIGAGAMSIEMQTRKLSKVSGHTITIELGERLGSSLAQRYIQKELGEQWTLEFAIETLKTQMV